MVTGTGIDGVILAGGESRRMGRDKALLPVTGSSLLEHQVGLMVLAVAHLYVAANAVPAPPLAGVTLVGDALPGREGPLSGILAALQVSQAARVWIMPCDSFGLGLPVLQGLEQALADSGADIAFLRQGGHDHPLVALWRTSLLPALEAFVAGGGRSVFRWYATQKVVAVDWPLHKGQCFNLNTPEHYQQLLDDLRAMPDDKAE